MARSSLHLKDHWQEQRLFLSRVIAAAIFVLLMTGVLVTRLVQLQVLDVRKYEVQAARQSERTIKLDPRRGAIVDRNGHLLAMHSMEDAWPVSIDIALAKAYTAASVSSNENAISSRSIGLLTQPGGPLWNVGNSNDPGTGDDTIEERGLIEFPGGLALYKNGVLVGAIGVSGDGVDQDELVAEAGAAGYEPSPVIRVDCVLGLAGAYSANAAPCPGA